MSDGSPAYAGGFIDVNGARVHYLHAGTGVPLVLIHGLVGSSANWQENIGALARNSSVYAIDLIGAGRSQRIADIEVSLNATADRVAATMDALGIECADIAGHSHGGSVAIALAARHPQRVRSLILFSPANPFCHLPDRLIRFYSSAIGRLVAKCGPYLPRSVQHAALARMYGDPSRISEDCLESYLEPLRVPGAVDHILAIVRGWFADMVRLREFLPPVANTPILLIWGDHDAAIDLNSGIELKRELVNSELVIVPSAGHVVFEELPAESNRIMLDWLSRRSTNSINSSQAPMAEATAP